MSLSNYSHVRMLCVSVLGVYGQIAAAQAATRNVPGQYPTIQAAINASSNGDTIVIAPGSYVGASNRDISFNGKAITVRSTNPNDSAIVAATIIDCQHLGRAFVFQSAETAASKLQGLTITNGLVNVMLNDEDTPLDDDVDGGGAGILCKNSSPTIENNVLVGNVAKGKYGLPVGGAILCLNSNAVIKNNIIRCNQSLIPDSYLGAGGGIGCVKSSPLIQGNQIENNLAGPGQLLCPIAIPVDEATPSEPLLLPEGASPLLSDRHMIGERNASACLGVAYSQGGGIYLYYGCAPTIMDNDIIGNKAIIYRVGSVCMGNTYIVQGGGVFSHVSTQIPSCDPIFSHNRLKDNRAVVVARYNPGNYTEFYAEGGGYHGSGSNPFCNNHIVGNVAEIKTTPGITLDGSHYVLAVGGGICTINLSILNDTVVDNEALVNQVVGGSAEAYGGGIMVNTYWPGTGYANIRNTIVWNNVATTFDPQIHNHPDNGAIDVNYCDVQGTVWPGTGNKNYDPKLATDRLHIASNSSCRNAGDPAYTGDGQCGTDIDGDNRVINGRVDMGADEYR